MQPPRNIYSSESVMAFYSAGSVRDFWSLESRVFQRRFWESLGMDTCKTLFGVIVFQHKKDCTLIIRPFCQNYTDTSFLDYCYFSPASAKVLKAFAMEFSSRPQSAEIRMTVATLRRIKFGTVSQALDAIERASKIQGATRFASAGDLSIQDHDAWHGEVGVDYNGKIKRHRPRCLE